MFSSKIQSIISFLIISTSISTSQSVATLGEKFLSSKIVTNDEFWLSKSNPAGIQCVMDFLIRNLKKSEYISMFLAYKDVLSGDGELLLQRIVEHFPAYIMYNKMKLLGPYEFYQNAFILTDNISSLGSFEVNYLNLCNTRCFYTIFLTTDFDNEVEIIDEAKSWIDVLDRENIFNSMILYRIQNEFYMLRSNEFVPDVPCHLAPPLFFGKCQSDWQNWLSFADVQKMNGCMIKLGYFENPPFIFEKDGVPTGIEQDILNIISRELNVTLVSDRIEWDENSNLNEKIISLLNEYHIVHGGLTRNPDKEIMYSVSYETVPIVWLVPIQSKITINGIITPFTSQVWIAIIISFVIGLVKSCFIPKQLTFLEMFALFIGIGWYEQPTKLSTRLMFFSWTIYGLLITQFYLASSSSKLVSGSISYLRTIDDLLNSNFILGVDKTLVKNWNTVNANKNVSEDTKRLRRKVKENYKVYERDEFVIMMEDMLSGLQDDYALAVRLNSSNGFPKFTENVYILDELIGNFPLAYVLKNGAPFADKFDELILWIKANGLVEYSGRNYRNLDWDLENSRMSETISFENIVPGFMCLGAAYVLGLLMGVVEKIHAKFKNHLNT